MVNKKGQEMSVATLVLIVIGIVVLVMLILGFSMGWQNLWGKINILGGGSNIETVVQACNIAATSDSIVSYCKEFKLIKETEGKNFVNCQYGKIQESLDNRLGCGDRTALQNAQEYAKPICMALTKGATTAVDAKTAFEKDKTRYNGKICSDLFTMTFTPATTSTPAKTELADKQF